MVSSILEYLDRTAECYGDKVAYEDSAERVTFRQLKQRISCIGGALLHEGIHKGTMAVYMEKSVAAISAFFGAEAAGCSYCPLDTKMPAERLRVVLETLNPPAICTTRELAAKIGHMGYGDKIVIYEELLNGKSDEEQLRLIRKARIDTDPLYVLFTSGSTGVPKGVMIPHRAVIDYLEWITKKFDFQFQDVIGNQGELFFDLSVQDVYAPILCGCKTILLPRNIFASPAELVCQMKEKGITLTFWIPSAYGLVANLDGMRAAVPTSLRVAMACGEVMPCKQLNYWRKHLPDTMFVNLYGPTEAAVACTYYIVNRTFHDEESLPIGVPCENTDILVLDEENRLVDKENGGIGELCIRGSSLALGYYGNPEMTEAAFVQNPCNSVYKEIIYRTGDLVYYGTDGNLMYVSRKDFQIKHLGYRIELGEIEAAAGLVEGVEECACIYDNLKKRILLFYTGKPWDGKNFKEVLAKRLPHYMIPNRIVHLEVMPHNRNGKLDRRYLKEQYL